LQVIEFELLALADIVTETIVLVGLRSLKSKQFDPANVSM
jgi:hypothetical protein